MKLEQHKSAGQGHYETRFDGDDGPVGFPTSRYFQIHFEYLDSQIDEVRRMLQQLHVRLGELSQRIAKDAVRDRRDGRRLDVEASSRKPARHQSNQRQASSASRLTDRNSG